VAELQKALVAERPISRCGVSWPECRCSRLDREWRCGSEHSASAPRASDC